MPLARAISVGLLLLATVARAEEAETTDLARRHYQSGSAYFEQSRYDDAIREFRESHRLAPRADLLFNVARCFQRKGDAARAVDAYEEYLRASPKAVDRPSIEHDLGELRLRVGAVRVVDAPAGSEIFVDGYTVGRAPLAGTVTATAGARLIEARPGEGKAPLRALVNVRAHGEVTATIPPPEKEIVVITKEVGSRWYASKPAWIIAGGGAALAIVGAALLGRARPTQDAAQADTTEADWRAGQDRARLFQDLGAAFLAVGGAAVAVGAVLFVMRGRSSEAAARPLARWITPTGNGLALGGSF